ncbi:UNVERIFIED_CONTAM: hypothetical protein PYX00_005164 [Menopon gallinae]|uniref:Iduronate 2-sulfatase n=1 Tax=Menopon gallinae TaxID=328185 RepID=A0AAW2HQB2_9NEOP
MALKICFGAKNVLLIIVDDLRPSLGGYGDPDAYTPKIDRLMKESIVFRNAFAQQALCAPSRNSLLTSRRPDTLHLYDFYNYWRDFTGNFTTLPQYFKENSYVTQSIGKVFHPGESSNFTDDYPYSWSCPPWHPPSEKFKDAPVCLNKDGMFADLICPVSISEQPGGTLPDIESVSEACKYLHTMRDNKHFFLAVGFHKPHIPLKFPREFLDYHPLDNVSLPRFRQYPPGLPTVAWNPWTDIRWRHDISQLNLTFPFQVLEDSWVKLIRQSYQASVTYIDSLVGKLLSCLTNSGLDRNTIVILLGDHGWSLGEHGEWSKYSNFDVAVRVPLIIRVPYLTYLVENSRNMEESGWYSNEIVELVDIFPTVVDLAGLRGIPICPKNVTNISICTEGRSLLPLIMNTVLQKYKVHRAGRKNLALSQYPRPGLFPTRHPNSDKPRLSEIKIMGYSIRTENYRYTEWIEWSPKQLQGNWSNIYNVELYDHSIDPNENLNLANRPGLEEIQNKLKLQLRREFG